MDTIKIKNRCLGIMVVYDPLRALIAIERFNALISNSFRDHTIRVVTNNLSVGGDIIGSNKCGEFSGWAEGVSDADYHNYDIIIFANDTFHNKRPFGVYEQRRFLEKLAAATSKSSQFLVGEICWHIDYQLLLKREKCVLKWVRTNIFAISTGAAQKIGGIALEDSYLASMVQSDVDGDFMLSSDLSQVSRRRVENWLNPASPSLGWHGSQTATRNIKRLKARCIIQELYLTQRCVEAGISVYSTAILRKRDIFLNLLYNLQNRFC